VNWDGIGWVLWRELGRGGKIDGKWGGKVGDMGNGKRDGMGKWEIGWWDG